MKRVGWQALLGIGLLVLSLAIFMVQHLSFHRDTDTFFYLLQDLAFLPVQVLLVSLILSRFLSERERRSRLRKMNMVIGAFFNEVGTQLLAVFSTFNVEPRQLEEMLRGLKEWSETDFGDRARRLKSHVYRVESRRGDLDGLKSFLGARQDFLLRLLENPNLLEHETFTDLLWAVFHVSDELAHRADFTSLPEKDYEHLSLDISRALALLTVEWLSYLRHLRRDYPYLFSLAVRTNPLDPEARVVFD